MQRGVVATDLVMHQTYVKLQKLISGHMCLTCASADPQPRVINIGDTDTGALLHIEDAGKLSVKPEMQMTNAEKNVKVNNIFQLRDVSIVFECVWAVNLLINEGVRLIC